MRAFLLAAGCGERLRPITDTLPKCLVPIAGRPLLAYWMDLLAAHAVSDVLINTHHLPQPVREFAATHVPPPHITLTYEPELLGSAGTVRANRAFVQCEADFVVAYADNLTRIDLTALMAYHTEHRALVTMALFHAPDPCQCGIAELAADGRITTFVEKPQRPASDLANAGVYAMSAAIFDHLDTDTARDFGRDVFPRLLAAGARVCGWETMAYHLDIGTPAALAQAQRDAATWPQELRA